MNHKVLLLSQSFTRIKDANLQLTAYASRTPTSSSLPTLLSERLSSTPPSAASSKRLAGGCREGLGFRCRPRFGTLGYREVWPQSLQSVNLVEPSKSMQRAAQASCRVRLWMMWGFVCFVYSLENWLTLIVTELKGLSLIHMYDSLQTLNRKLDKGERKTPCHPISCTTRRTKLSHPHSSPGVKGKCERMTNSIRNYKARLYPVRPEPSFSTNHLGDAIMTPVTLEIFRSTLATPPTQYGPQ